MTDRNSPDSGETAREETTEIRRRRGEAVIAELSGGEVPPELVAMEQEWPLLANTIYAFAGGELLTRTVLVPRTRQLALCAGFAARGQLDYFAIHSRYAIAAGVTPNELREIVHLTMLTGGLPRAVQAAHVLGEVVRTAPPARQ